MSNEEPLVIACLCADWCRTCEAYRETFDKACSAISAFAPDRPALRFIWIDVENQSDLVGELDIETFPTILIACGCGPLFLGAILPHAQTLDRLVRCALDGSLPLMSSPQPEALALADRLIADPLVEVR
jgi:thioredoxin 1